MYSSSKRRRIKPFARPTSFDFNAAYDIRHFQRIKYGQVTSALMPTGRMTEEAYQVMEGEVLMQNTLPSVRRYGDHQMHVFSFANGLGAGIESDDYSANHQQLLEGLQYAGVAVTGFQPETDVFEQGFVVTVAGLNTLFNNGASTLYPGDIICADIPNPKDRSRQTGIPNGKIQFVVSPYKVLKDQIGPQNASRFIMGTALSFAKPGDPVDVVLHRCNVMIQGITQSQCDDKVKDAVKKAKDEAKAKAAKTKKTRGGGSSKTN